MCVGRQMFYNVAAKAENNHKVALVSCDTTRLHKSPRFTTFVRDLCCFLNIQHEKYYHTALGGYYVTPA